MIVCAVEDLLFSMNISSAAKRQGVEVYFERTPGRVLSSVRDKQPVLLILDLNSVRLKPMDVIAGLKADPSLSGVKTLGYVSHADADTIARARDAGIDEVLARSAFTLQIAEILGRDSAD